MTRLRDNLKEVLSTIKLMETRQKTMEERQVDMGRALKENKISLQTLELRSITVSNGEIVGSPLELELSPVGAIANVAEANDNSPVVAKLDQVDQHEELAVKGITEATNKQKEQADIHRPVNASFAKNSSADGHHEVDGNKKTANARENKKRKKVGVCVVQCLLIVVEWLPNCLSVLFFFLVPLGWGEGG